MAEPKFTKGPWVIGAPYQDDEGFREIPIHSMADGRTYTPASVCLQFPGASGMQDANACLIAAAPDLYAALKAFLDAGYGHGDFEDEWPAARAALARARGEQP